MERILLAYSGGLETSVAIPWLAETFGSEIISVTLDVGQGRELGRIRERALEAGAVRAHVLDVRPEFASEYILPALKAGAIGPGGDPLAMALQHSLLARKMVQIADLEQADAIAHCAIDPDDQVLEAAVRTLNADIQVIAVARQWGMTQSDRVAYAGARGIPVPVTDQSFRTDENLWGRSIAGGVLEDPWAEPPEEVYVLTKSPSECPDEPAYAEIEFEGGVPVAVSGIPMPLPELIVSLETIAGAHGVGRIDVVDNRRPRRASRSIWEAPAAVALHAAHRDLQRFVTAHDLERIAREQGAAYANLIDAGLWFTPAREAMDAFVSRVQEHVTGAVRLKFSKGHCYVVGRRAGDRAATAAVAPDHASIASPTPLKGASTVS